MRLLAAHGLRPDTELGQHFLLDENLVDLAVREAGVGPGDTVLEVGAGLGVLTAALARAAGTVHAVEIDRRLEPALARGGCGTHATSGSTGADALRMPLEELDPAPTALVANLPYSIATPLVVESLWRLPGVERWCVMAQREVVDRWLAPPGGRLYGVPSVLLQLTAEATFRRSVGREVFAPRPRVDSALVALRRTAPGPTAAVRALVRTAFGARRKTLVNALAAAGADKDRTRAALGALGHRSRRAPRGAAARRLRRPGAGAVLERLSLAAPAKLNLRLAVAPRAGDGYHPVTSLMVALDGLADVLEVRRAGGAGCAVRASRAPATWSGRRSTRSRPRPAAPSRWRWRSTSASRPRPGWAAAPATRRPRWWPWTASTASAWGRSGSRPWRRGWDRTCPFFVRGGTQWAEGRGERLRRASAPEFAALLVKGEAGLSTAAVYRAFDRLPPPAPHPPGEPPPRLPALAAWVRNDLWPAAFALAPGLGAAARALGLAGAGAVLLCGSGSCLAGLYPDRASADAAARAWPGGGFRAVVTPA